MTDQKPNEEGPREETEHDEDEHPAEQEVGEKEGPTKDDRIAEVAKKEIESTSVGDLSRRFRVSKERVRLALRERGITLKSQAEVLEKEGPEEAKDKDERIVERVTDAQATSLVRDWTEQTTKGLLRDIQDVGTVTVDQLRPVAAARGVSVMDLIDGALRDQKTLWDLKQRYAEQVESFGFGDNFLRYVSTVMEFHENYHDIPLQLEQVEQLLESMLTREAHEAKTKELTALLLSGRREDKMRFLLEMGVGGQ